ncbi:hypothetical protein M9Y10_024894 [Tritrichomonas musculus]|uniref:Myb-like DNA-binding domain containing protein n=1 Tax=Tritrichomonas musculus TaxID=1915356 RepID=A0ABR2HCR4_9EUKA
MSEPNNCVLLPSIDCLPLTQLCINFFQEQEEKARTFFATLDPYYNEQRNMPIIPQKPQINQSTNLNYPNNITFVTNSGYTPNCNIESQNKHNMKTTSAIKGSWTPEEDNKLREAVMNCDPILWDIVAEKVPGRSAIQCKERWLYRLNPDVKKTRFEKWEDDLIINERNRVGNHWTLIANKLPGRTSCAVKNRWYSVLRNKVETNNTFPF